jgi:hypothetical protein
LIKLKQKLPGSIPRAIRERFVQDEDRSTKWTYRRTKTDRAGWTDGHLFKPENSSSCFEIDSHNKAEIIKSELESNDHRKEEIVNSETAEESDKNLEESGEEIWSLATETFDDVDVETVVADDESNGGSESDTSGIFSLDVSDSEQRNYWN